MKSIVRGAALLIVAFFGLFGAVALGVILHEYSHFKDFTGLARDSQICALSLPTDFFKITTGFAYYSFEADPQKENEVNQISKYTEFKAYSITLIVMLLFLVSLEIVFKWIKRGDLVYK
jgi:hypothetical protein